MILDGTSSTTTAGTAGGRAAQDEQKVKGDLNRFLTMLVTQLQNQDPLEPLDANQFTTQLVQFASVEQQIYQNANLEKLLAGQQGSQLTGSVGYIGHLVEAGGDSLPLQDGAALATYRLPQAAAEATLSISDADGRMLFSAPVATQAGAHSFRWDGRDGKGQALPDGTYSFNVTATDRSGGAIAAEQGFVGEVTGVAQGGSGAELLLGSLTVPVDSVTAVRERPAATVAAGD